MLLPTNDGVFSLNSVEGPFGSSQKEITRYSVAYDAGSELNSETCATIPGPQCGGNGEGYNPAGGEGFVHRQYYLNGFIFTGVLSYSRFD